MKIKGISVLSFMGIFFIALTLFAIALGVSWFMRNDKMAWFDITLFLTNYYGWIVIPICRWTAKKCFDENNHASVDN